SVRRRGGASATAEGSMTSSWVKRSISARPRTFTHCPFFTGGLASASPRTKALTVMESVLSVMSKVSSCPPRTSRASHVSTSPSTMTSRRGSRKSPSGVGSPSMRSTSRDDPARPLPRRRLSRPERDGNAVGGPLEDEVHVLVFVQLLQGRRLLRRRRFFGPVRRRRFPSRRRHGRGRGRRRVVPGGRRHVRFRPLGLPLKDEGHPVHAGDGLQQPLLQLPQRLVRDGPRTGQHHTPRPADRVHLHPLQRRRAHRGGFVLGQARQHFAQRVGLFRLNDVYAHWCTSLSGQ